jgi:hypothetical protein
MISNILALEGRYPSRSNLEEVAERLGIHYMAVSKFIAWHRKWILQALPPNIEKLQNMVHCICFNPQEVIADLPAVAEL